MATVARNTSGKVELRKVSGRSKAQAAKTRVELDKQLGVKTPSYIVRLAKKAPL